MGVGFHTWEGFDTGCGVSHRGRGFIQGGEGCWGSCKQIVVAFIIHQTRQSSGGTNG